MSDGTRITKLKAIVAHHQAATIDGLLVDAAAANALVTVFDALKTDEARAKFERLPLPRLVDFAWKHVRVG